MYQWNLRVVLFCIPWWLRTLNIFFFSASWPFDMPLLRILKYATKERERTCRDHIQRLDTVPSWGMGQPTHLKNINPELLLSKGNTETKRGADTEGKIFQRLHHLAIHPINRHQTQTLLLMPRSACWQEHDIAEPERLCQSLTNRDADACSQPSE